MYHGPLSQVNRCIHWFWTFCSIYCRSWISKSETSRWKGGMESLFLCLRGEKLNYKTRWAHRVKFISRYLTSNHDAVVKNKKVVTVKLINFGTNATSSVEPFIHLTQAVTLTGQGNGELIKDSINRLQKSSLATSQYIEATRKLVTLLDSSKLMWTRIECCHEIKLEKYICQLNTQS